MCTSHSKLVKSFQAKVWPVNFTSFWIYFLADFCNLALLCAAFAQCCCHFAAMGLNAHCFRGMSKLKFSSQCSAVLHSLDESWLLFLPKGWGEIVWSWIFFQNSFQVFLLLHCSFILEISLQPLLGICFSIFVLIIKVIRIMLASCISIQYSVNLVRLC